MNKEDRLTIACANYLRAKYPSVLFTHVANERRTSKARGGKLKKMGVRAGVSDFIIFYPCGGYAALIVELKVDAGTYEKGKWKSKKSYPSKTQREFLLKTQAVGYAVDVVWTVDDFHRLVDAYMSGKYEPSEYMKGMIKREKEAE